MRSQVLSVAVILLLFSLIGCGKRLDTGVVQKEPVPNYVRDFDQEAMRRTMSEARKSYFLFVDALKDRKPTMRSFAVKKGFPMPGGKTTEDIWLTDVTFDGTNFMGKISNDPVETREVKRGDVVRVKPAELSDWMYVENDVLRGGYTIRLIAQNQSEAERKQFEKKAGFKIQ
jgi:uncharacterized protein YegJ (DUF2314 family)